MILEITRDEDNGQRCFGKATFGDLSFHTIERPWLENHPQTSCIPHGSYQAAIYASPTKGSVYLLQAVPNRSMCEIHAANFAHELLGCIALGYSRGQIDGEDAILDSRRAIKDFMDAAGGLPITVTIK